MNRPLWIAALVLVTAVLAAGPLNAQDDGGGFGGGGFGGGGIDLGGFGGGGGGGGRGGGGQPQQQNPPRVRDLLLQTNSAESLITLLKAALEKDKAPKLSKDQEKELTAFITKEVKASAAAIDAKAKELGLNAPGAQAATPPIGKSGQEIVLLYIELGNGRGGNTGNNNQNRGNGGNRGGNANNNNNNANNTRLTALVLRPAEEAFLVTLANAPTLNAKQKTAVVKWKNDVLKQRGGIDEFRIQIEEAGAPPLTADQIKQLQTIFDDADQKRTTLRNDLSGRIRDLLNPGEAAAAAAAANSQTQNQNQNQNAFNQLQNLGRVEESKLAVLSAELRQKTDALEKDTNTKILRALLEPQRQPFVLIEQQRQLQRQQQLKQQMQQVLAPRG